MGSIENIKKELLHYADNVEVEIISDHKCIVKVPEREIAGIIGKEGKNIKEIEKRIGLGIDVQELTKKDIEKSREDKKEVPFDIREKKNSIIFDMGIKMQHKDADIYIVNDFLLTVKAGQLG